MHFTLSVRNGICSYLYKFPDIFWVQWGHVQQSRVEPPAMLSMPPMNLLSIPTIRVAGNYLKVDLKTYYTF